MARDGDNDLTRKKARAAPEERVDVGELDEIIDTGGDRPKQRGRTPEPGSAGPAKVFVLVAIGLAAVVLVGCGLWWFLGGERVGTPPAPRDLPKKYFAFLPNRPVRIELPNGLPGDANLAHLGQMGGGLFSGADLDVQVEFHGVRPDDSKVVCYFLKKPVDVDVFAKRHPEFTASNDKGRAIFTPTDHSSSPKMFVAGPTTVVIVNGASGVNRGTAYDKLFDEVFARELDSFEVPDDQWEVLTQVTGCVGKIAAEPREAAARFSAVATTFKASGPLKADARLSAGFYAVAAYPDEDRAMQVLAEFQENRRTLEAEMAGFAKGLPAGGRTPTLARWTRGRFLHVLTEYPR